MRPLLPALLLLTGCQSAYYATMETFGIDKRSILVDRVDDARESQADAQEQFQTTYEAFQALTGFEGGDLEKLYKKLKSEYEDATDDAEEVTDRIDSIEQVAKDLFEEWEEEIDTISNPEMQEDSRDMLRETRSQLDGVVQSMRSAEATMAPVLKRFNDHVLYLKHSLNAQAIGSLRNDSAEVGRDIEALIKRMEASIAEAEAFIANMRPNG
jgi:Skp family chaperone for outer membrane proteins